MNGSNVGSLFLCVTKFCLNLKQRPQKLQKNTSEESGFPSLSKGVIFPLSSIFLSLFPPNAFGELGGFKLPGYGLEPKGLDLTQFIDPMPFFRSHSEFLFLPFFIHNYKSTFIFFRKNLPWVGGFCVRAGLGYRIFCS